MVIGSWLSLYSLLSERGRAGIFCGATSILYVGLRGGPISKSVLHLHFTACIIAP